MASPGAKPGGQTPGGGGPSLDGSAAVMKSGTHFSAGLIGWTAGFHIGGQPVGGIASCVWAWAWPAPAANIAATAMTRGEQPARPRSIRAG